MIRRFIYKNLPVTKIYIGIAKVLYFFTTLFYGKKPRIIVRNNITYEVDLSEGINLSLFLFGSFQKHVIKSELLTIPKDGTIVDVGANFGLMSLPFAQLVPLGKVYSFEPTHYALANLERNLSLNPELAKRIEVINSFVSAKSTENAGIKAFSSWKVNNEKAEVMHPTHLGAAKSADGVPSITLNDFCKNENLSRLDFIKIDTDGHEYEVLSGAAEAIAKYRPQIIFEIGLYVMAEKGIDFSFYDNYFGKLNYRMYDSASKALITLENHKTFIPAKATIDIIAKPE
jgi:FkbM family methyltransferase